METLLNSRSIPLTATMRARSRRTASPSWEPGHRDRCLNPKMLYSYMDNRFVVLSGCSGGGKSSLLEELRSRGYRVIAEPGRRIVQVEELENNGRALPWLDLKPLHAKRFEQRTMILDLQRVFRDGCFLIEDWLTLRWPSNTQQTKLCRRLFAIVITARSSLFHHGRRYMPQIPSANTASKRPCRSSNVSEPPMKP